MKERNKILEAKVVDQEKDFKAFRIEINNMFKDNVELEKVEIESEHSTSENEIQNSCKKCDFVGKSEVGLKIHLTTKHKVVSLKVYTKISK